MSRPRRQRYVVAADGRQFIAAAFWRQVDKQDAGSGCWLWTGRTSKGYGQYRGGAHRVAYLLLVGPIPDGLELDPLCRVPRCVNPDHLEPVTREENARRRSEAQTHCAQGHEFTPENTFFYDQRVCKTCAADRQRRYRDKRRRRRNHLYAVAAHLMTADSLDRDTFLRLADEAEAVAK